MNFLVKAVAIIAGCFSLVYALPYYYNYTMITLNDKETVDLSPIMKWGKEGVNYTIGGETSSGKRVMFRDHLTGSGMVVITCYSQRNELLIAADPSNAADSATVRRLLLNELTWMQRNGIVAMTDEAISAAITVIMAKKTTGNAVMYFTQTRTAEPVAGAVDFQYSIPPSPLQFGKWDNRYVVVVLNKTEVISPTSIDNLGQNNTHFFKKSDLVRPNGEYDYYSYTFRSHFDTLSLIFFEYDRSATRNPLGVILCFVLDTLKNSTGYNFGSAIRTELDFLVKAGCMQITASTIQGASDSLSAKGAGFWYETTTGKTQPRIGIPDFSFTLPPSSLPLPPTSLQQPAGHDAAPVQSTLRTTNYCGGVTFFLDGSGVTKAQSMLSIMDMIGRTIRIFPMTIGANETPTEIFWDGRNQNGLPIHNGRYIAHLKTASVQLFRPFYLMRR